MEKRINMKKIAHFWPIVIKPYSGFGILLNNSIPMGLKIFEDRFYVTVLGIPISFVKLEKLSSYYAVGNRMVGTQLVLKGIVLEYKDGSKDIIGAFSNSKKRKILETFRSIMPNKEKQ